MLAKYFTESYRNIDINRTNSINVFNVSAFNYRSKKFNDDFTFFEYFSENFVNATDINIITE